VRTTKDQTVAAGHSIDPTRWQAALQELLDRIAGRFARVEPRRRASAFVRGLLADLPRKNCWTISEHAGDPSPDGMQHLLSQAVWDADAVRDDVRDYVIDHLADAQAVLVIDETGDLKKGTATVGVQRQYTGTAGKVDNAQVAVYLVYASPVGTRSLIGSCMCPGAGSPTGTAALPPGCPSSSGLGPSPSGQGDACACPGCRGPGRLGDRR
jgi:SRSO17 transposase